jgi:trans-2-enoyl-CoA reductase
MRKNIKLQYTDHGRPEEVLQLIEEKIGEPEEGEVMLWLKYASINPAHLLTIRGFYGKLQILPAVPGTEASGIVELVGRTVKK